MILSSICYTPGGILLFCAGFWSSILLDRLTSHVTRHVVRRRLYSERSGRARNRLAALGAIPISVVQEGKDLNGVDPSRRSVAL
jgi:hypothetical protein